MHPASAPDQLAALPLMAQVLVGTRMLRRAALAMLGGSTDAPAEPILAACDAIDRVAFRGDGILAERAAFRHAERQPLPAAALAVSQALHWAIDSCEGAIGAYDFPVDAGVTASVERCLAAIAADHRVNSVQLALLAATDLDLLRFTCGEARIGKYDGLGEQVRGRLIPIHPLTLSTPPRSAEEEAR